MTGRQLIAIDTDPGVDDALALMYACHHPAARLELVTTVAGNVPISLATRNAARLLACLQPQARVTLARGGARPLREKLVTATHVHGDDGLAGAAALLPDAGPAARRDAASHLVQLARSHGPDLTVIALGPLTNIARAIELDEAAMRNIGALVVMGGAIDVPGNITPLAEFNIYVDPHAADAVFAAGLPTVVIPLDITQQVRLRQFRPPKAVADRFPVQSAMVTRFIEHGLGGRWREEGMPLHDPLAVAIALHPALAKTQPLTLRVETGGTLSRGQVVTDRRANAPEDPRPPVHVALEVDAAAALQEICDHLLPGQAKSKSADRNRPAVAVIGGANIDYTVTAPSLPAAGETVQGADLLTALGGKGANQAVAAARAGASVHFFSQLGSDSGGDTFRAALVREHITLHESAVRGQMPTGTALICVNAQGENQIAVAPGANRRFDWRRVEAAEAVLRRSTLLAAPLELPMAALERAFTTAKRLGLQTLLNAAPALPISDRLQAAVDVLVVNEVEASEYTGRKVNNRQQAETALKALRRLGFPTIVLTLGEDGALASDGQQLVWQAAYPVEVVDTTGAGDTFVGYLAFGLAQGSPLPEAMDLAARAAARAVTQRGAQTAIPTLRQARSVKRSGPPPSNM